MAEIIFCTSCGTPFDLSKSACTCGNVMAFSEKNELANKLSKIEKYQLINSHHGSEVQEIILNELPSYNLSKTYFIGSSAKQDYENKVYYIKNCLIPNVTVWKNAVQEADAILANDKVELYGRLLGITDFAIREFFGKFALKGNEAEIFEEYRDFSKYELSKVMNDYNITLDDIQTTNFETIGIDVFNAISDTLHNGSFLELADKEELTKDDFNKVKGEVAVAVAGQLISGITSMISQNSQAISNVREADSNLNKKLSHISKLSQSLMIEEQEINKYKMLFDKSDLIIDTCYNKILKPIVDELKKDPVYIKYKIAREPYDLQESRIEIENQALKVNLEVSFWRSLLSNARGNFNYHLNKRLKVINSLERYNSINKKLKEKRHKSLKAKFNYEVDKTELFRQYELENRRVLRETEIIKKNKDTVVQFFNVLKIIKGNIIR